MCIEENKEQEKIYENFFLGIVFSIERIDLIDSFFSQLGFVKFSHNITSPSHCYVQKDQWNLAGIPIGGTEQKR